MANTRADVSVPAKTWVNLYTASGITAGTAVGVYNKGSYAALLTIAAAQPTITTGGIPIYISDSPASYRAVSTGEAGLWAYSLYGTTLLVQES